MDQDESIAGLRSRVSALVEQESALLTQAFDLSRAGGDARAVDSLFARVQAIQVERNSLKRRIGSILGTQRLCDAREVWKPGTYDYREEVGGSSVRVQVTRGPLGLQVRIPHTPKPVDIESLQGTFDGPLSVDDAPAQHEEAAAPSKPAKGRGRKKAE